MFLIEERVFCGCVRRSTQSNLTGLPGPSSETKLQQNRKRNRLWEGRKVARDTGWMTGNTSVNTLKLRIERELWNIAAVSQEPNQKATVALWLVYILVFINHPAVISAPTFIQPPFANASFVSRQVSTLKCQNDSVTVLPNVTKLLFHSNALEKDTTFNFVVSSLFSIISWIFSMVLDVDF